MVFGDSHDQISNDSLHIEFIAIPGSLIPSGILNGKIRPQILILSEFGMDISTDYYYNVALVCKDVVQFDDNTTVDDILPLLDTTPCLSVIALCTLLKIDGFYPVNPDFEAQKSLLEDLSTQILVDFEVVLEREQKRNMDECALADIDFEFVIDSSGENV